MSRLFVNIIKRVTEKEDAFTECLAETLRGDPVLARDFLLQVCGEDVEAVSVARAEIQIETQKEFPGACLDMLFRLDGKSTVGVENKLWSPESEGQLSKYLRLGLNRMAFITDYYAPVEDEVLQDPHYLAPQNGRHHFVWSDFYSVVETSAKKNAAPFLNRALLELFKHLGFEPPHPQIGDLLHPDPGIQKINRENFAKLWEPTRQGLQKRGWKSIGRGSVAELYVQNGIARNLAWAWIDPIWGGLKVRLTLREGVSPGEVIERLKSVHLPYREDIGISEMHPRGRKEPGIVVEVRISLTKLLAKTTTVEEMEARLADFVLNVFDLVG